jgi:hypothetical protein
MTDTGDGFLDSMVERSGDVVFAFFLGPVDDSSTELSGDAVTRSAFLVVTVSPHLDAPSDTCRGRSCVIATAAIMAMRSSDSSEDSPSVLLGVFAVYLRQRELFVIYLQGRQENLPWMVVQVPLGDFCNLSTCNAGRNEHHSESIHNTIQRERNVSTLNIAIKNAVQLSVKHTFLRQKDRRHLHPNLLIRCVGCRAATICAGPGPETCGAYVGVQAAV